MSPSRQRCAPWAATGHTGTGAVLTAKCHVNRERYCYWDQRGNKGCRGMDKGAGKSCKYSVLQLNFLSYL